MCPVASSVACLEALVDRDGHVEEVTVLYSIPLLDKAAIEAVRGNSSRPRIFPRD